MVFGGGVLLGTCVGFKGLLGARRAEKSLERSRDWSRGPRRAPTRFVALRRPALATWRGGVARGGRARALFGLLKQCLQTSPFDDGARRSSASSHLG